MYAVLNPNRVLVVFLYAGAVVESITTAGASKSAAAQGNLHQIRSGGRLIAAGLVLQAVVESYVLVIVSIIHLRCRKAGMASPNVRILCITLYRTSSLVLIRCIARAVESFYAFANLDCRANGTCGPIIRGEWFLYVFELAPMLVLTWWLNLLHPGRQLPRQKNRYLDLDGRTERTGPGWVDRRSRWMTFADPLDLRGVLRGEPSHERFWVTGEEWAVCGDSFAVGTGSNVRRERKGR